MFGTNTVFILGAGASWNYFFPLASELRQKIAHHAETTSLHVVYNQYESVGLPESEIYHLIRTYAQSGELCSIDRFLEQIRESHPTWIDPGKRIIAHELLKYEAKDKQRLQRHPNRNTRDIGVQTEARPDWYSFIWEKISPTRKQELDLNEKITVITFNYDRSFEYRMSNIIANRYGINGGIEEAYRSYFVKAFDVLHVHGQLGTLFDNTGSGLEVPYGEDPTIDIVARAANQIQIYSDSDHDEDTFKKVKLALQHAKSLYILGFAFHPQNCERIKLNSAMTNQSMSLVVSRTGVTNVEWEAIYRRIGRDPEKNTDVGAEHHDILATLRTSRIFNLA